MINSKDINIGDIVYYVRRDGYMYQPVVKFGQVNDMFSNGVYVYSILPKEDRLINGVPYNDFVTPTKWQKLPKGWTYKTDLFTIGYNYNENLKNIHINNPDEILKGLDNGDLILGDKKDYSHIEAEITKENGFRLIRKSDSNWHYYATTVGYNEIYKTYDEASQWIADYNKELKRQSELTDKEWSLEQIENTVKKYIYVCYIDEEVRKEKIDKYMNYFTNLNNVEDIETRATVDGIQWKYWKNKKWNNITEDMLRRIK